ncbi:MAG: RnfABCDGE type electron transport complex subunit G, partial [bacterium]
MRETLRLVFILTIICAVAAISLAKVYEVTKEPIAYQRRLQKLRALKAVLPDFDNEPDKDIKEVPFGKKNILFYLGYKGNELTGTAVKAVGDGFGGSIELMVGIKPDGVINGVEILTHKESPGLGARIIEDKFKGQFKGRSLANTTWLVKKDGGDIDQITAATISPRGVTKAIDEALKLYKKYAPPM